jgi:hypothetical protein
VYQYIPSNKKPFIAYLALKSNAMQRINMRVIARDMQKPYTVYTDRAILVDPGMVRNIKMQFPIAPNQMQILAINKNSGIGANYNDPSFVAQIQKITPGVQTCDVWMDLQTESFVKAAEWFASNAGLLSIGDYRSMDGQFLIRYLPYLSVTDKSGNEIMSNTPSRVGHITGKIEVSQRHFLNYSVPARFIILLHEYAHKFQNPKLKKEMEDESAADMNALYIYLGRGYPRTDAREVFLNIFYRARTEENLMRYNKIEEFIKRFEQKNNCT